MKLNQLGLINPLTAARFHKTVQKIETTEIFHSKLYTFLGIFKSTMDGDPNLNFLRYYVDNGEKNDRNNR